MPQVISKQLPAALILVLRVFIGNGLPHRFAPGNDEEKTVVPDTRRFGISSRYRRKRYKAADLVLAVLAGDLCRNFKPSVCPNTGFTDQGLIKKPICPPETWITVGGSDRTQRFFGSTNRPFDRPLTGSLLFMKLVGLTGDRDVGVSPSREGQDPPLPWKAGLFGGRICAFYAVKCANPAPI